ncbi:MAG: zinc-ribbon domain-containing protein, partial [Deltaproteobacteria bacterium]|nr:zinc-ribbon domain-containing protein [Deltaproteobacteria bacterium]
MAALKQIICPKCLAKLKFDPDKITAEVVKFKCPNCKTVLSIRKPPAQKEPPSPLPPELSKPDTGPVSETQGADTPDQPQKPNDKI